MYERITHKYTYIHICIYSDACIDPPLRPAVPTPKAPRKRVPCMWAHARSRIGGAVAQTGRAASKPDRARPAIVRAAGPGAAHTASNVVTDAVFHAPMFALNAFAE
jgi:hypothetical protein